MSKLASPMQRATFAGLALLFGPCAAADEPPRDLNYVLIAEADGTRRLLLFSDTAAAADPSPGTMAADDERAAALRLLESGDARERVRGITLLSGAPDRQALEIVSLMLNDPEQRVRDEAAAFVADHPLTDAATRALYAEADEH